MDNIAIVAVAYNRPNSLSRLLNSLNQADYQSRLDIPLIISIDWSSEAEKVYEIAENFNWMHGPKEIIKHSKNLGLKKHIMLCGDLTQRYENIAVFEDDLYVAPGFFQFGLKSIDYYRGCRHIAGISLYTPEWNQTSNRFFSFEKMRFDTFFIQYAQSWGQIWTKKWWDEFKIWLEKENDKIFSEAIVPENVKRWENNKSWLKDHIKYCIESNKYFVYSTVSYSTNFSEEGEHNSFTSPSYQVNLFNETKKDFSFAEFSSEAIRYDSFFEREGLHKDLNISKTDLTIDLYGEKKQWNKYLLTTKVLNYKILKSYGMKLRPHELNVIKGITGSDIYLYDTELIDLESNHKSNSRVSDIKLSIYDLRATSNRTLLLLNSYYMKLTIGRKLKSLLKFK